VLGHRGARHAEPENTLLAFDQALEEGAVGVELDVRMTGDGELIVAHDPELPAPLPGEATGDETTARGTAQEDAGHGDARRGVRFCELSASQLRAIRLPKGQRIPTLREALEWQLDTRALMNVELKGDVPSQGHVVRAACALLREHGGEGILISSFYPRMILECARLLPDVPTAWLVHAEQRLLKRAPGWRWTGAAAVHPQCLDLPAARVRALQGGGAIVNVWTVNDPVEGRRLAQLGVDGLITDAPARLLAALAPETPRPPRGDGSGALQTAQSEQTDERTTTPAGGV
jgi:glycerophosphoryl diester phosphodiesterase